MPYIFYGHFIFTYLISSLIIFLLLVKLSCIPKNQARFFFGLSFGLGPIIISWILTCLLALFPRHSNLFYITLIYSIFIFILAIVYEEFPIWLSALRPQFFPSGIYPKFLFSLIVLMFMLNFILIKLIPMFNSDPLDYMHMALIISQKKDLSVYPMMTSHNMRSLIASWTHPLGFMGVYIWTYLGGLMQLSDLCLQITSFFYAVSLCIAMVCIFDRAHIIIGLLSSLLLISTPLYFYQVYQSGIDPIRFYTFFISLMFLGKIIQAEYDDRRNILNYFILGLTLGLACFSHSIGLLGLPIASVIYFTMSPCSLLQKIRNITIFCTIPLLFIAPRLWINLKIFHSLIKDTSPVWGLEFIQYDTTLNIIRGLGTPTERIFNGLLKGLTNIKIFGISYWIILVGFFVIKFNLKNLKNKIFVQSPNFLILISAEVLICFYLMALISLLLGMNVFIKNDRYILTIQPFVTLIAGYVIFIFYQRFCGTEKETV